MKIEWLTFLLIITIFMISGAKQTGAFNSENGKARKILKEGLLSFQEPYGSWKVNNSQLILDGQNPQNKRTNLWLKEEYGDFILELNFKLDSGTNSGVFFRTTDSSNPVQTGIEVQIRDDYCKTPINKNFCGSIYDIREVSENRVKKPGKWNYLKLVCKGSEIEVYLNKGKVVDIDLNEWEKPGVNPDGTSNKFKTAYKNMARMGKIGFQDHGGRVWYKNIHITKL